MIRKAHINDVKEIHKLINYYANKDIMLAKSLSDIYENIRDFWVFQEKRRVIGCVALHIIGWEGLAEIKSLAVSGDKHRKGIGRELVNSCLEEAKGLKIKNIFALTYACQFFKKLGFNRISKSKLPHKIWLECSKCPKFPACKEEAFIKEVVSS